MRADDRIAGYWDEHNKSLLANGNPLWITVDQKILMDFLIQQKPESVLEVGCGRGRWLTVLRDAKISQVYGLDIAPTAIAHSKTVFPTFDLREHNIGNGPVPDIQVDMTISTQVLHHITPDKILPALKALAAMTKPGGLFFHITWYEPTQPFENGYSEPEYLRRHKNSFNHNYPLLLAQAGLKLLESREIVYDNKARNFVFLAQTEAQE